MSSQLSEETLRNQKVYILVMGLTGAGKSTFVSVGTESNIRIGKGGTKRVTKHVHDYELNYRQGNVSYEIHLIDTPGLDDDATRNPEILSSITEFINRDKKDIAGVLYLHDISQSKSDASQRTLQLLERFVGRDLWGHCTLVITKGLPTNDKEVGETKEKKKGKKKEKKEKKENEKTLDVKKDSRVMLHNSHHAKVARFNDKTRPQVLDILKPYLTRNLVPLMCKQMVESNSPQLTLRETDGWKLSTAADFEVAQAENHELPSAQPFDEGKFEDFKARRNKILLHQKKHLRGSFAIKFAIFSVEVVDVLTLGLGSVVTKSAKKSAKTRQQKHKHMDEKEMEELKYDFMKYLIEIRAFGQYNTEWLEKSKVKRLKDLEKEALKKRKSAKTRRWKCKPRHQGSNDDRSGSDDFYTDSSSDS